MGQDDLNCLMGVMLNWVVLVSTFNLLIDAVDSREGNGSHPALISLICLIYLILYHKIYSEVVLGTIPIPALNVGNTPCLISLWPDEHMSS